jgi:hypothetical protein
VANTNAGLANAAAKPQVSTLYRTTNQLQQQEPGDKNQELIRLKKEYHQMMLRELQKKQLASS